MRTGVLLTPIRKVLDYPIHVLVRGHDHVDRVEARLRFAVGRDRLDD